MIGLMQPLLFSTWNETQAKQEVMIDIPAAQLQRPSTTNEQKTNIKLMSKALGFCLLSCIGVISEEGPCPCTSVLSTPLPPSFYGVCHEEGRGRSLRVCPQGERGQKSWRACGRMNEGAVMQRGFSRIMSELPELKCLIHITRTKAPQISRHLYQNELKLILGWHMSLERKWAFTKNC